MHLSTFPESARRDPAAVIAAHRIDPERRELYVEGTDDRHFLNWLLGDTKDSEATIREIATINIDADGGARGRAVALAEAAVRAGVPATGLRVLVDADHDRLLARSLPPNCWRTDLRDLEGYFLRIECIERLWRLAVRRDVDAEKILTSVMAEAAKIGVLRLLSDRDGLALPFQATDLGKRVTASKEQVSVDLDALLRALLQNARIGLDRHQEIKGLYAELARSEPQPSCDLVHGHDCVTLFGEILAQHGVSRVEADRLLRLSFERWMADEHAVLSEVISWLDAA